MNAPVVTTVGRQSILILTKKTYEVLMANPYYLVSYRISRIIGDVDIHNEVTTNDLFMKILKPSISVHTSWEWV